MPTYEYKCDSCGHDFEEFQGIKENPIETCPVCNEKVHRVINGGAGLIFKGTGFYITDYKNSNSSFGRNGKKGSSSNGSNGSNGTKKKSGEKTKENTDVSSKKDK
ncbi:FmdB family zinc ribbon protein [candidate division KSB1 bacterium]